MPRPPRSRLLRTTPAFVLLVVLVVVVAQLAGVAGRRDVPDGTLVFDGTHETWLVKVPSAPSAGLGRAAKQLGGGSAGTKVAGGWYEVELSDDVSAADAEAAFGTVGATAVEPVLPREPYEGPHGVGDSSDAPRTTPRAGDAPDEMEDAPGAFGDGVQLREGPLTATRLGEQWGLSQASDKDIDAPQAWQSTTGTGAVVAVIDTGVDATHPDLAGRVLPGVDFSGSGTPATTDRVGHGTQVASVIAANGTSIAGVAPDARILPLKVFRDSATRFSMTGYLQAIRYAADQGVDVINISLGCGGTPSCYSQAELEALTYAIDRGVVVVAAVGNGDQSGRGVDNDAPATPDYPSGYELPGVIAVTSITRSGSWATWANYGASSVDIAAPGEGILVAAPGGSFRTEAGNSFAAPHVAGVAALVATRNPTAAPADITARILQGATLEPSLAGRSTTGGVLNADAALAALGSAAGGGAASVPVPSTPKAGARVARPPVLTWTLPDGWSSSRIHFTGPGPDVDVTVPAASRALAHPSSAWRSGTYRWQVVARSTDGRTVTSAPQAYTIAPRVGAWVSSGRVRNHGRSVRLRIGYAASEPTATVRIVVRAGGKVVYTSKALRRTEHLRGVGSPRRGWFTHTGAVSRQLRAGQKIIVEVRVVAGSTRLTRRFHATVS